MSYKPKFCCECGEKIERVDWKISDSRRFCELCATNFALSDKMRLVGAALCIVVGIAGIVGYWRTPEKPLTVTSSHLISNTPNIDKAETKQTNSVPVSSNIPVQPASGVQKEKNAFVAATPNLKNKPEAVTAEEPVYFCGAPTKKGTPCSRRVKGGGRCWQHEGQTSMMAQEKLLVTKN